MKRFNPVLVYAGTPPLLTFSSADGTPIVIDNTTNKAYYNNAGTVTQIAGGGGGGTVTSVTGTSPVVSSGGTTPAISLLGLSGLGSPLQVVRVNAGATALEYATASGGGITAGTGDVTFSGTGSVATTIALGVEHGWTATQYISQATLTDASTITPNVTSQNNLGLSPSDCLSVEDSPAGIKSATIAGLFCGAVRTEFTIEEQLVKADFIMDSVQELFIVLKNIFR